MEEPPIWPAQAGSRHDVHPFEVGGTLGLIRLSRSGSSTAIFVHRWLGVALCTVFLIWFPSGIGMMWDYPGVWRTIVSSDRPRSANVVSHRNRPTPR
jgi:hypothetical protein